MSDRRQPAQAAVVQAAPARAAPARGAACALVIGSSHAAVVWAGGRRVVPCAAAPELVAALERTASPRWVWWSNEPAAWLLEHGVRVARCWDLTAVHRLLFGGAETSAAQIWAALQGLSAHGLPASGQLDLLRSAGDGDGGDLESPVRPDGYLRPEWADGGWSRSADRVAAWAQTALSAASLQSDRLRSLQVGADPVACARSESAAELLCAELAHDGLPIDLTVAHALIAAIIGPRPLDEAQALEARRRRDGAVLAHAPAGDRTDLRNPAHVRALLARIGIDVADTRSWRLAPYAGTHPLVAPLLEWRRAERIATTYGYGWLDRHVSGPDGDTRLRGRWSGSDGAAGRMTAQAGLHNLPAELRPAVAAPAGRLLVRADLGQIEPRVLAVVSGDPALVAATQDDDLYLPVARRLGVPRPVAKVAVLAAMYGQTSGAAGRALRGLESAYPMAMGQLRSAYEAGRAGGSVRTYGGRLVRASRLPPDLDEPGERAALAARGRFLRNAVIQGAAAELFKAWAATVRARAAPLGARIVLCLHDELLVESPADQAPAVARVVDECLQEAAAAWAPASGVRFVADVGILRRWSEAKDAVPADED